MRRQAMEIFMQIIERIKELLGIASERALEEVIHEGLKLETISISRNHYNQFKMKEEIDREKFIEDLSSEIKKIKKYTYSGVGPYTTNHIQSKPKVYIASMFLKYAVAEKDRQTINELLKLHHADPRIEDPISGICAITFMLSKDENENEEAEERFAEGCLREFVKCSNPTKVNQDDCLILSELWSLDSFHNKKILADLLDVLYDFDPNTKQNYGIGKFELENKLLPIY